MAEGLMHWVVQENIRDEAIYDDFIQALQDFKVEHTVVKVIPFAHDTIPDVDPANPVIVWGSTSLDMVAKKKNWKPGTFLNENFDQRVWGLIYGGHLLNADARIYEFNNIPVFDGLRFIRPVHDMKVFAGTVIDGRELQRWQTAIMALAYEFSTLRPDTPVSVSSVKEIDAESRFFVVDGRVVAGSMYRLTGRQKMERALPRDADWQFAQSMVNLWHPATAFVIDVALIGCDEPNTGTFKVIEINCINSCGFYAADMRAVVEAIEAL